ncbi:hypothetical protein ACFLU0_00310 [Chloroflexota bacterium]
MTLLASAAQHHGLRYYGVYPHAHVLVSWNTDSHHDFPRYVGVFGGVTFALTDSNSREISENRGKPQ